MLWTDREEAETAGRKISDLYFDGLPPTVFEAMVSEGDVYRFGVRLGPAPSNG